MQVANSVIIPGQGKPWDMYVGKQIRKLYFETLKGYTRLLQVATIFSGKLLPLYIGYVEGMKVENLDLRNSMLEKLGLVFPPLPELQSLDLSNCLLRYLDPGNNRFFIIISCAYTLIYVTMYKVPENETKTSVVLPSTMQTIGRS